MDDPSATPLLQNVPCVSANADTIAVSTATPISADSTPRGTCGTPSEFTALRKVVEVREMAIGQLVVTCGLSAGLKAMEDAEINPIVNHGKPSPLVRWEMTSLAAHCHTVVAATLMLRMRRRCQ